MYQADNFFIFLWPPRENLVPTALLRLLAFK